MCTCNGKTLEQGASTGKVTTRRFVQLLVIMAKRGELTGAAKHIPLVAAAEGRRGGDGSLKRHLCTQ